MHFRPVMHRRNEQRADEHADDVDEREEIDDKDLFPDDEENEERRRDPLRNRIPE